MSRPQRHRARPLRCCVVHGVVVLGALLALPAGAQVYASAQADDEAAPLVLSNFASDDTPRLLIDVPAAVTAVTPPATAVAAGSPAPASAEPIEPPRISVAPGVPATLLPWFQHVGREHALPASLLMAVAAVESGFNPRARSPKGAQGLMQLMPATARQLGVRQVWAIGDNLRGGASYLRALLQRYAGDLALALAAYNAGEGAVQRAGNRIPDIEETRLYVPKVIAWQRQYAAHDAQRPPAPAKALRTAAASADPPGTRTP
ncbi:lytic transglycosylase domain-containing protein [Leptothrix sp. BB-4]